MVYFVTGGSRGLGAGIVRAAARAGHDVAFTWRQDREAADALVDEVSASGVRARAWQLDVRDARAVEQVADEVLDALGEVDAVVSNAGIRRDGMAMSMSDEDWASVLETNLYGAFYLCRAFLPTFLARRQGRFVFVSSVARHGISGQINYSASKAGLVGLSASLAKEYGRKGITSNVVVPGFFDTDMTRDGIGETIGEFVTRFSPSGRRGEVEELAHAVLFLTSPGASFVNGQALGVTGGLDWGP